MKWILFAVSSLSLSLSAAEPLTLPLWPDGAPGQMTTPSEATAEFIRKRSGKNTVTNVTAPTLTVYRPEKPNGTSVIVAPGGAYAFLSAVHEGTQVCEWLNTLGVTGILLTYRTPTRDEPSPHEKPVQDAQRALEIIRQHAAEWRLNPERIGLLGFSAGGNLLAHLACHRDLENYPQNHDLNARKPRPNFGIMIYGGGLLDPADPLKLKAGFTVSPDAPPLFMACASDDGNNPIAATLLYLEYKKHNLPAELHLFSKGGHGFGMRDNGHPINAWPARCAEWMDSNGWLPSVAKLDAAIQRAEDEMQTIITNLCKIPCAGDLPVFLRQIAQVKSELAESSSVSDSQRRIQLEETLKEMQTSVEILKQDLQQAAHNTEKWLETANRLKTDIVRLQAEREWLQQPPSSQ